MESTKEEKSLKKKIDGEIKTLAEQLSVLRPLNLFDGWQTRLQLVTLLETYKNLFKTEHKDHGKYKNEYEQAKASFTSELNRLNEFERRPLPVAPTLVPPQSVGGTGEFQSKEDEDMCKYFVRSFIESDGCRDNWFDNITGLEHVKQQLVDNLVSARVLSSMFSRTPKGFLLYGPPGVGKTLLIKALVNELRDKTSSHIKLKGQIGALFYNVGAAELKDKYIGESEKKIQNLFKMASLAAETVQESERSKGNSNYKVFSIIFMDEVDDIAPDRSKNTSGTSSVNSLLTAIDGMTSSSNVVVIAATNHPAEVDSAFRERLPKRIFLDYPTEQDIYNFLAQRIDIIINKNIQVSHLGVGGNPSMRTSKVKGCDIIALYEESNCKKPGPREYSMLQEEIAKFMPNLTKEDLLNLAIACSGKNVNFDGERSPFAVLSGRTDRLSNRQLDSIITQASERAANRASNIGVFAKSRIGGKDYLFSLDSFPVVEWMGKDPATFQFIKQEKPPLKPIITFNIHKTIATEKDIQRISPVEHTCYHLKFLPFINTTLLNPTDAYYGVSPLDNKDFYSNSYLGYLAETAFYCMGKFELVKKTELEVDQLNITEVRDAIVSYFRGADNSSYFDTYSQEDKVYSLGESTRFKSSNKIYSDGGKEYLNELVEHMVRGHWDFDYFREKLKEASLPSFNYSKIINALRWARLRSEFYGKTHTLLLKYRVAFYYNPISNDVGNYDNETPTRALSKGELSSSTDYFVEDIYVQISETKPELEGEGVISLLDVEDIKPVSIWDTTTVDRLQQQKWEDMTPEQRAKFIEDIKPEGHKSSYNRLVAERAEFLENLADFKTSENKNILFYIPDSYTSAGEVEKLNEIWHEDGDVQTQKLNQMKYLKSLSSRKMYAGELDEKAKVQQERSFFNFFKFWQKEQTSTQTSIQAFAKHKVRPFDMDKMGGLTNMEKLLYKKVFKGNDLSEINFDNEPRLDLALNWNIDIRDLVEAASRERQSFSADKYKALQDFK